ncbi:hypothetical protein GCM10009813_23840 [Brevibacterium marinum]
MGALVERVGPLSAGDHPADVGGVEEQVGADLIGDLADLRDGMLEEVERAAHRDQARLHFASHVRQGVEVTAVGVDADR